MKAKLAAVFVVGLVLGAACPYLLRQPAVLAQNQNQAQPQQQNHEHRWEYRLVFMGYGQRETNMTDVATRLTTEFNRLGAQGWEVVQSTGVPGGPTGSFVLFKRSRR